MDLKQSLQSGALESLNLSDSTSKRHYVPSIFSLQVISLLFNKPATKAIQKEFKITLTITNVLQSIWSTQN